MSTKKAHRYSQHLQSLGIQLDSYQDDEWASTLSSLIRFPQYVVRSIIGMPLLFLGLFIAVLVVLSYNDKTAFVALVLPFGLALSLINGFLWGAIRFISRLGNDLNRVLDLTLEKFEVVVAQARGVGSKGKARSSLADLFQSFVFGMVLPDVTKVIKKSVPLVGGLAAFLAGRVFMGMSKRVSKRLKKNEAQQPIDQKQSETVQQQQRIAIVQKIERGADTFTSHSVRIASFPFKVFAFLLGGSTILFFWIAWGIAG
ncbi:MAG: hypothetical protein AAF206_23875 [Bacteroidota bacterium]